MGALNSAMLGLAMVFMALGVLRDAHEHGLSWFHAIVVVYFSIIGTVMVVVPVVNNQGTIRRFIQFVLT